MQEEAHDYIFLDGTEERELLIDRIGQARQGVRLVIDSVPEDLWYTPRYHGWTPAAMLGHLNLSDNLSLLLLRSALLGLRLKLSARQLDHLNNISARLFQKRLVAASLRSMERNQQRLADFVLHLPINKFSLQVYNPGTQTFTTVERGLQEFFLFHWEDHLKTMRQVEGIQPPAEPGAAPPSRSDNM